MNKRILLTTIGALAWAGLGGIAAAQENAADKAVEAAKQYAGVTTINTAEEAGLMAMLGINITGPEWEQLTGIEVQRERASVRGALHQADAGAQGGERRLRHAARSARPGWPTWRAPERSSRSTPTSRNTA